MRHAAIFCRFLHAMLSPCFSSAIFSMLIFRLRHAAGHVAEWHNALMRD